MLSIRVSWKFLSYFGDIDDIAAILKRDFLLPSRIVDEDEAMTVFFFGLTNIASTLKDAVSYGEEGHECQEG